MRVRVYVRVDLRVDLGSQSRASLRQEQLLLMGDVVLVRKAIFIPIDRLRRKCGAAGSVAIGWWALGGGHSGRGGGGGSGAGAF